MRRSQVLGVAGLVVALLGLVGCGGAPPTIEGELVPTVEQPAVAPDGETIGEVAVPVEGFDHIPNGESGDYAHYPPSSGEHYAAPARWGRYEEPLPPEVWVHNLEHSGIAILYNCPEGCEETVEAIVTWARGAKPSTWGYQKVLLFPNDQIESRIVALAWGWQLDQDEFDPDEMTVFYERHLDDGPEDAP